MNFEETLQALYHEYIRSRNISDALYASLMECIVRGYITDEKKLKEQELAALLHISRTPVREAMIQLESNGWIKEGEILSVSFSDMIEQFSYFRSLNAYSVALFAQKANNLQLQGLPLISSHQRNAPLSCYSIVRTTDYEQNILMRSVKMTGNDLLFQENLYLFKRIMRFIIIANVPEIIDSFRDCYCKLFDDLLEAFAQKDGHLAHHLVYSYWTKNIVAVLQKASTEKVYFENNTTGI